MPVRIPEACLVRLISALGGLEAPGLAGSSIPDDGRGARGGSVYDRPIGEVTFGAPANYCGLLDTAEVFDAIVSQAESLPRSAAQVAVTGNYDDVPSVVLSASNSSPSQMKGHAALARPSSQGKHIVNADDPSAQHS
jgi:hypothetical protein